MKTFIFVLVLSLITMSQVKKKTGQGDECWNTELFGWPLAATHVLVLCGEMRPRGFVEGHDDGHHVLAVKDGCRQNVAGRELRQLVHKWAEVLVLQRPHRTQVTNVAVTVTSSSLFFFVSTEKKRRTTWENRQNS